MKTKLLMTACAFIIAASSNADITETTKPKDTTKVVRALVQPAVSSQFANKKILSRSVNPVPELNSSEKKRGYIIFQHPTVETIYPQTHPLPTERIEQLTAFGSPGERLNLSFAVYPVRKLKKFKVRVKQLEQFEPLCRLLTYWKTGFGKRWYASVKKRLQLLPQLLEPLTEYSSPAGQTQRYWITLQIPADIKAGEYSGKICLMDEGYDKAVWLPLKIKILPIKLQRSAEMGLSAFHGSVLSSPFWKKRLGAAKVKKMADTDYRTMRKLGFSMAPVIMAIWNNSTQTLSVNPVEIELLRKNGFSGAIPVGLPLRMIKILYSKYVSDGKLTAYTAQRLLKTLPPEAFYKDITGIVAKLEATRKKNNWPEFIYLPIDEVQSLSATFGSKVYTAVKKTGVKIFATAQGPGQNSNWPIYSDCVDFWDNSGFARNFKQIKQDKKHGYWAYQNYTICAKGWNVLKSARAVFGYCFWKSGYQVLNPWTWRSGFNRKGIDYCREPFGSNKIGPDGKLYTTPNWECVSQGINDGKYIYTLVKMLLEREASSETACRKACADAKSLLSRIWGQTNIAFHVKYNDIWPSQNFEYYRWQLAQTIMRLGKFPATKSKRTEFDLKCELDSLEKQNKAKIISEQKSNLDIFYIGGKDFSTWKTNRHPEVSIKHETLANGRKAFTAKIKVNHKNGAGYVGINAPLNGIDLNKFDTLIFRAKITSNRPELQAGQATIKTFIISEQGKWPKNKIYERNDISAVSEGNWKEYRIPVSKIVSRYPKLAKQAKSFALILFESTYKDEDCINYCFDEFKLIKASEMEIGRIIVADGVLLPCRAIQVGIQLAGFDEDKAKDCKLRIKLVQKSKLIYEQILDDLKQINAAELELSSAKPGNAQLKVELLDKSGKTIATKIKLLTIAKL